MRLTAIVLAMLVTGAADAPSLIGAVKSGDAAAVRALLQQKADVNAAEADGATALHWASYRDDLASADALLRAGANVNAANDLGATALWMASMNGSVGMVRRLLDGGANPNAKLLSGETPVMVASRSGHAAVVQLLVDRKAGVNVRASRNQTALMWAVAQKHPEVVTILLANGADVKARSDTWTNVEAVPPHAIGLLIQLLPVGLELRVGGKEVVVADRRAELLAGRRHCRDGRLRARLRRRHEEQYGEDERADSIEHHVRTRMARV